MVIKWIDVLFLCAIVVTVAVTLYYTVPTTSEKVRENCIPTGKVLVRNIKTWTEYDCKGVTLPE